MLHIIVDAKVRRDVEGKLGRPTLSAMSPTFRLNSLVVAGEACKNLVTDAAAYIYQPHPYARSSKRKDSWYIYQLSSYVICPHSYESLWV